MTNITAARRSIRRYNTGTLAQRSVWRGHLYTILLAAGMTAEDASYAAHVGDDWDGMDTPSSAACRLLRVA